MIVLIFFFKKKFMNSLVGFKRGDLFNDPNSILSFSNISSDNTEFKVLFFFFEKKMIMLERSGLCLRKHRKRRYLQFDEEIQLKSSLGFNFLI